MPQPDHSRQKAQAIALLFEGRWTRDEIAARIGLTKRTVDRWLHDDEAFKGQLAAMRADFAASVRDVAYADKARRIVALDQMAESARRVYEEHPLLKETRPTPDGEIVTERFNRDAHEAFREALADIAAELGQRKNVTELSGAVDVNNRVTFYMPQPELPPPDGLDDLALPEPEAAPLDE